MRRTLMGMILVLAFALPDALAQKPNSAPTLNQTKFDALYRAAKTVQGSQAIGVTYSKFADLLQNFATELVIAKDRAATAREGELVNIYAACLIIYNDSLKL